MNNRPRETHFIITLQTGNMSPCVWLSISSCLLDLIILAVSGKPIPVDFPHPLPGFHSIGSNNFDTPPQWWTDFRNAGGLPSFPSDHVQEKQGLQPVEIFMICFASILTLVVICMFIVRRAACVACVKEHCFARGTDPHEQVIDLSTAMGFSASANPALHRAILHPYQQHMIVPPALEPSMATYDLPPAYNELFPDGRGGGLKPPGTPQQVSPSAPPLSTARSFSRHTRSFSLQM